MKAWMVLLIVLVAGSVWAETPTQEEQEKMFMEAVLLKQEGLYAEAEVRLKKLAEWQPHQPTIKRMLQEVQERGRLQQTDPAKALKRRLEELIVPEVSFRDAVVGDVVEFLRNESVKLSTDKGGVNIVWQAPEDAKLKKLTLSLRQVPLGDIIRYAVQAAGLKYRVESYAVVIYQPEPAVAQTPDEPKSE